MDPLYNARLLYALRIEDNSTVDRRLTTSTRGLFDIENYPSENFKAQFRFRKADIEKIKNALEFPERLTLKHRFNDLPCSV
jgi:hypothetical protein